MNVFIVLIPMLLMSAVFMEIRVIEMSMPREAAAASRPPAPPLALTLRVSGQSYVVEGAGIAPQSFARNAATGSTGVLGKTTAAQLMATFAQIAAVHPENKEIRIVAEAGTRYQEIVTLMDLARSAGLPQAALEGAGSEGV
jgi:biopolymer transport protein ExbD